MHRIATTLKTTWLTTALAVVLSFGAMAQQMPLRLHFGNVVNDKPIVLDNATYKNALGQTYTVSNLKYYISNIKLHTPSGQILSDSGYYLIRKDDPASLDVTLKNVPAGAYDKLTFMIGVDSLHNCSGAQSDALDPVNGMFWTWNTGYIFFKLEGKSNVSKNPGGIYEYHIGGYREPNNTIRSVTIDLPATRTEGKTVHDIQEINIAADIAKMIDGAQPLDMAKYNSVTDYHNAAMIADRYRQMFSLDHVSYGH